MPKRTTLPRLSAEARANLLAHYNAAPDPETRTRYQMVLLAAQGRTTYEIAPLVQRSRDVVMRVLQRYRDDGLPASGRLWSRSGPGGTCGRCSTTPIQRTVTVAASCRDSGRALALGRIVSAVFVRLGPLVPREQPTRRGDRSQSY
jgi:hypothetical protein